MFVLGVAIGPGLGLLLARFAVQRTGSWLKVAFIALVLVFILFLPFLELELRLGLVVGMLLGAMLAVSPFALSELAGPTEESTRL